ncbi:MAG TPA: hypothetical protein VGN82_14195 [Bosea sp. (in: a-proteobacteria)]|jgi:hypothetical protein|uniref:phage baseplate plug family protein n=1 Tax=Bosea sp. (in: a-proteobacteria) TaxID=1871050 RepID=UPI002E1549DD|nr:hypothetical protein [Bosea sp. (in: a-proteobacteria)]
MPYRELPIIDAPSQAFTTTLAGRRCDFAVNYSTFDDRWSFNLDVDGVRVLSGRKIVLGVDLVAPFALGIGSLIAAPWGDEGAQPGRTELPSGRVRLFHYDPAEAAA